MIKLSKYGSEEVKGIIKFNKFPQRLGLHKDVDGQTWDIQGLIWGKHVWACKRSSLHPYYTSTATNGSYFGVVDQSWDTYEVEVVND